MDKLRLTVVSSGSGDPDLLNTKTINALKNAGKLILRTGRHPLTAWLEKNKIAYETLDSLYEKADDFDQLNQLIADYILGFSSPDNIVYAVPDALTDFTVRYLVRTFPERIEADVVPGVGYYDLNISASLPHMPDAGITVITSYDLLSFGYHDPNQSVLITELDNTILAGRVKLLLSDSLGDEYNVVLLTQQKKPHIMPLFELDRRPDLDHRSSLLVPGSAFQNRTRFVFRDLMTLMDTLRSQDGCPWDRKQTHGSLRPYLVEESWECVAAIDQCDMDHLCEELGDLLFQIAFHSSIGRSYDEFTIDDVITSICSKMIRRHPHVFSGRRLNPDEGTGAVWERIKRQETGHDTVIGSMDDVSPGLPSLKYASKMFKKLNQTKAYSDRPPSSLVSGIGETLSLIAASPGNASDMDLGLLLLKCTELCFSLGMDGEMLLRQAADRMKNKLRKAETRINQDGKSFEDLTFSELGVYLQYVEDETE